MAVLAARRRWLSDSPRHSRGRVHQHRRRPDGGALDAAQLAQAYSFGPLYTANHYGAGTTVALVEMSVGRVRRE